MWQNKTFTGIFCHAAALASKNQVANTKYLPQAASRTLPTPSENVSFLADPVITATGVETIANMETTNQRTIS